MKFKLAQNYLKDTLNRDPNTIELTNYLGGLRPAKIGKISGSEIQRVENLLRS